jgi:hypothetical protein
LTVWYLTLFGQVFVALVTHTLYGQERLDMAYLH